MKAVRARIATVAMTIVRFEPDRAIAPPLTAARPILTGLKRSLAGPMDRCGKRAARMLVYTPCHTYSMQRSDPEAMNPTRKPESELKIVRLSKGPLTAVPLPPTFTFFFDGKPVSYSFRELPTVQPRCNYWKVIKERGSSRVSADGVKNGSYSSANHGAGFLLADRPFRNGEHHGR